jgi:hypothetical protein
MLAETGKGGIALAEEKKARESTASPRRIRRGKNWLQGSRLWAGNPVLLLFFRRKNRLLSFSTFLRRHGEERGGFLVNVFAATLRAFDLTLFVFVERKDDFKWLLAIFTVELIARHMDLRRTPGRLGFYTPSTLE